MQNEKMCSTCGETKPATLEYFFKTSKPQNGLSARCKVCCSVIKRKWYQQNKETINEKHREWYQQNKEHAKEYSKKYSEAHKTEIKNYYQTKYYKNKEGYLKKAKKYREENKEHCRVRSKKYREKNSEKILAKANMWRKTHKEKVSESAKASCQKRRTAKEGLQATLTVQQWNNIVKHFGSKCAYCGKEKKLHQEHFVALIKGGEYTHNNIVPACHSCNSGKKDRDFFKWYPQQKFYSKSREKKILSFLHYSNNIQQLSLF
jgi:hypothetical protein